MSIATELQNLNDNILDAYTAVQDKGGTVPAHKNTDNLGTAINSIPAAGPLDGRRTINSNHVVVQALDGSSVYGDTTVTSIGPLSLAYLYANVSYSFSIREVDFRNVTVIDKGGMRCMFGTSDYDTYHGASIDTINFDSLQEVKDGGMHQAFLNNNIVTASFPALTTVGREAFYGAFQTSRASDATASFPALTSIPSSATRAFASAFNRFPQGASQRYGYKSVSFPNLTTVAAEEACYALLSDNVFCTTVDFGSLVTVSGESAFSRAFGGVPIANTADVFPELTTVSGASAFESAFGTTTLSGTTTGTVIGRFPKMTTVTGASAFRSAFGSSRVLTEISFPLLSTAGSGSFNGVTKSASALSTASFPSLAHITSGQNSAFNQAFQGCTSLVSADFSGLEDITSANQVFQSAFRDSTAITKVGAPSSAQDYTIDFSGLKTLSNAGYAFQEAFWGCTSLATVEFPSLQTITVSSSSYGYAFRGAFKDCTSLTSISFPALTAASYYCFDTVCKGCTALTTIDFPVLATVGSTTFKNAFEGCTSLATASFPALGTATGQSFIYAFKDCTSLSALSFPALTTSDNNTWQSMLSGCTGVTVHFPAAMQSTMSSWSSVTNGFGGTNTTVLFDL